MDDRLSVRKNLTHLVVFSITQEETVAKAQAGLKSTMRRLNRNLAQRGVNPVYLVVGFALLCFFCVYIWSKFHRRHWTSRIQECIVAVITEILLWISHKHTTKLKKKGYCWLFFFFQILPDCLNEPIWAWMAMSFENHSRRDCNVEECIF